MRAFSVTKGELIRNSMLFHQKAVQIRILADLICRPHTHGHKLRQLGRSCVIVWLMISIYY